MYKNNRNFQEDPSMSPSIFWDVAAALAILVVVVALAAGVFYGVQSALLYVMDHPLHPIEPKDYRLLSDEFQSYEQLSGSTEIPNVEETE